jgi:hypothetical protein
MRRLLLLAILFVCLETTAWAGMPAVLPSDLPTRLRLHESAAERFSAISFFLGGILLSALAVHWLWNYLQRDFTWLPRISVPKSLALVLLWGLLFVIVLTMISGARELMTPGAWRKQGFTYKLADSPSQHAAANDALEARKQRLKELRTSYWLWAGAHEGQLPGSVDELDGTMRLADEDHARPTLQYVSGRSLEGSAEVLIYEPNSVGPTRLALRTDGEIVELTTEQAAELDREAQP